MSGVDDVARMMTLQAEYTELLKQDPSERPRPLEEVAAEYAVAFSSALEYCEPNPAMD